MTMLRSICRRRTASSDDVAVCVALQTAAIQFRGLQEKSLKAGCCFANSCLEQLQPEGAGLCRFTDSLSLAVWLRSAAAPFPSKVDLIFQRWQGDSRAQKELGLSFRGRDLRQISRRSAGDQQASTRQMTVHCCMMLCLTSGSLSRRLDRRVLDQQRLVK